MITFILIRIIMIQEYSYWFKKIYLEEYLPTAIYFYQHLSKEDINHIYKEINKNEAIKAKLKFDLNCKLTKKRDKYLKRLEEIRNDRIRLYGSHKESIFSF